MLRASIALFGSLIFLPAASAQTVYRADIRNVQGEILRDHLKLGGANPRGDKIGFNSFYMEENGKPRLPVMGEFHYAPLSGSVLG